MPRKAIFLFVLAAGLASGSAVPEVQNGYVFVPELAAIDGVVCSKPIAGNALLVRLAQADAAHLKKKGISAAVPAAVAATAKPVAEDDPPLMTDLGTLSYPITTASKLAQQYFDQGFRLAWGFNHDEAGKAFRKAQRLDPNCAMCFWGEAWVLGPNINVPMDATAVAPAMAAAGKAYSLAVHARPNEQALIKAMSIRYSADPKAERAKLDVTYARAMAQTAARFPEDLDIATLYADALMNVSPWDYWEAGGKKLKAQVMPLLDTLQGVLKKRPDHPAAIHLYIHAVEASANPKRAERYADQLGKLAPGAGHLVHMPSHIYYRIGRYRDSLAVNRTAVKVDENYIARRRPSGVYPLGYYPHNVHFLMVSAQMAGDAPTVIDAAEKLARVIPDDAAREIPLLQPVKAAPYFEHAQFSDLATVLALRDPGADFPYLRAAWRYARGIVQARTGNPTAAAKEQAEIDHIVASADFKAFDEWKIPAKAVARISSRVLRARIAQAQNNLDGAVTDIEAAISIEDTLPYMEPPYWYYPVRQTLGGLLVLKGEYARARNVFRDSLARAPNNGWALYGLAQAYARDGKKGEALTVEQRLARAWIGDRKQLDLARL